MKKKPKAKVTYAAFDVADFLDNEEVVAEYFSAAAHDKNSDVLLKDSLFDMAKIFDNLNEEQLALVRARIQRSIDDPRPSIPAMKFSQVSRSTWKPIKTLEFCHLLRNECS